MNSKLTFDEDNTSGKVSARHNKTQDSSGIVGWLIQSKIANNKSTANAIMIGFVVVMFIVIYFVGFGGEVENPEDVLIMDAAGNNLIPYVEE